MVVITTQLTQGCYYVCEALFTCNVRRYDTGKLRMAEVRQQFQIKLRNSFTCLAGESTEFNNQEPMDGHKGEL